MTNWPEASAVASATALPASRSSTLAFGAARPAMTASPVGVDVHHVEGRLERQRRRSLAARRSAGALAAGGAGWTAGGTLGAFGSGALARTCVAAGLGQRNSGWVHSSAPATAPATTTVDAAVPPTQTSVFCDSMFARFRAGLYRESDHGYKSLRPLFTPETPRPAITSAAKSRERPTSRRRAHRSRAPSARGEKWCGPAFCA